MAEEKDQKSVVQGGQVTVNVADLQALVAAAVKAASEQNAAVIAQALIESKKPYVDPAQKANEDFMKQQMRVATERMDREREMARETCPHKQGCNPLSEFESTKSAFAIHQLDTGEVIGICTNCGKLISSLNPEDRPLFASKQGGNRPSRAGQRVFIDPLKAQKARTESLKSVAQVTDSSQQVQEAKNDRDIEDLVASQPTLA